MSLPSHQQRGLIRQTPLGVSLCQVPKRRFHLKRRATSLDRLLGSRKTLVLTATRYINTISPEQEPEFPGDEQMELRIRRMVRWNAVAMVVRANSRAPGI